MRDMLKNVPGRKSDVQDCQWLQQLYNYGLLQGSFRPDDQRVYYAVMLDNVVISLKVQLHTLIACKRR